MRSENSLKYRDEGRIHSGRVYLLYYAALFFLTFFAGIGLWFFIEGKTIISLPDGLQQHLTALSYWGEYLRKTAADFLHSGKLNLTMWDASLGFGSDVLTSLHYYCVGDPLALISAFVPQDRTEYLYAALTIIRIYLAGCAFSYFARKRGCGYSAILIGAVTYTTCGFIMLSGVMHPLFINAMIYLPLIAAGIDKIFDNGSPALYIAVTAMSGVTNFYFFYILAIIQFIYAVLEYFRRYRKFRIKEVLSLLMKFIFFYTAGTMSALIVLLPNIEAVLSSNRYSVDRIFSFFYPLYYYLVLPGSALLSYSSYMTSVDTVLALNAVSMAMVILLFIKKGREFREEKIAVILSSVLMCLPVFGKLMNGMAYESNRWNFAVPLLTSFIAAHMYPVIMDLTEKERKKFIFSIVLYFEISLVCVLLTLNFFIVSLIIFLLTGIIIAFFSGKKLPEKALRPVLIILIVICTAANGYNLYMYDDKQLLDLYTTPGTSDSTLRTDSPLQVLADLPYDGFARYDSTGSCVKVNSSMLSGVNSTSSYLSLSSPYISSFKKAISLCAPLENYISDLDRRCIPDKLMSVRYFIVTEDKAGLRPCSFTKQAGEYTDSSGIRYLIYEDPDCLPLAYTYSRYIPEDSFYALSAAGRQEALLQGVVLNDCDMAECRPQDPDDKSSVCEPQSTDGLTVQPGRITVTKNNSHTSVNIGNSVNAECYLEINGLEYQPAEGSYSGKGNSEGSQNSLLMKLFPKTEASELDISGNDLLTEFICFSREASYYDGSKDFLFNLSGSGSEVTLTFRSCGMYSFDSMNIISQPLDDIDSKVSALKEDTLENVVIDGNTITGDIDLDTSKFLLYSIPYSKGWTAYVDGQKAELRNANIMFMGLELAPGSHHIVLKYCTPGLKAGAIISACGVAAFTVMLIIYAKKKKDPARKEKL